jgi:hypothetical protein
VKRSKALSNAQQKTEISNEAPCITLITVKKKKAKLAKQTNDD